MAEKPPVGDAGPVILVLEGRVAPGGQSALESFLAEAIGYYESPGGIRVRLEWDRGDPCRFRELIEYASEASYAADDERTRSDDRMRDLLATWRGLLVADPVVSTWRPDPGIGPGRRSVSGLTVRPATEHDPIGTWLRESWGSSTIAVHGDLIDGAALPALVAERFGRRCGLLTYDRAPGVWEILSCDATPHRRGIGTALVESLVGSARAGGAHTIRCTTTNDNLPALGFWQARGFRLVTVRPGEVDAARKRKPEIPRSGHGGLPIRDELELELALELGE